MRHPILIDGCGNSDGAKVRAVTSWEKQMARADELLRNKDTSASKYSQRTRRRKLRKTILVHSAWKLLFTGRLSERKNN